MLFSFWALIGRGGGVGARVRVADPKHPQFVFCVEISTSYLHSHHRPQKSPTSLWSSQYFNHSYHSQLQAWQWFSTKTRQKVRGWEATTMGRHKLRPDSPPPFKMQ